MLRLQLTFKLAALLVAGISGLIAQVTPNLDSIHVRLGPATYPRTAMDSEGTVVRVPAPAKRIVSLNRGIDEYLYQIVPPEHIVGVSAAAYGELSAVLPHVQKYKPGIVNVDINSILNLKPDLVFATDGTDLKTVRALQDANIPIFRLTSTPTALEQIAAKVQAIGYITGDDDGARRELNRFNSELAAIAAKCQKPHPPARIYAVSMTGFSVGDLTLFQEIIGIVKGINVAAEGGMHTYERASNAQIASWKPDWVFTWAVPDRTHDELSRWMEEPSLSTTTASKNKRVIVSEPKVLLPLSSLVTSFAKLIADTTCPAI